MRLARLSVETNETANSSTSATSTNECTVIGFFLIYFAWNAIFVFCFLSVSFSMQSDTQRPNICSTAIVSSLSHRMFSSSPLCCRYHYISLFGFLCVHYIHRFSRTQFRAAKSIVVNTRLCHWSYVHHRQFQIPKSNGRVCLTFISTCPADCQWGISDSVFTFTTNWPAPPIVELTTLIQSDHFEHEKR